MTVATKTKTRGKVLPASGECPACGEAQAVFGGSSHTCTSCQLVAPRGTFLSTSESSNASADVRAWTLSGRVD